MQLGVKEDTARAALRVLRELGWLKLVKHTGRGVGVYRLPKLDAVGSATADAYRGAVDALADDVAATDPVAAVIVAARQPGWGWLGDAPADAWLVALLGAAGVHGRGAVAVGGPARPGKTRAWLAGVAGRGDGDLAAGLAALSEQHDVAGQVRARLAENAAAQAEDLARQAAAAERGQWRGKARRLVTRIVREEAKAAPAELGKLDEGARAAWARRLQGRLATMELEPELRAAIAHLVTADLTAAGDAVAEAGGRWVAGLAA